MARSPSQEEHIKKLGWAIWLCQVDLGTLREGDWLNLKQELYDFVYPGWLSLDEKDKKLYQRWLNEKLGEAIPKIQERLKKQVDAVINGGTQKKETLGNLIYPGSTMIFKKDGIGVLYGSPNSPFSQVFHSNDMETRIERTFIDYLTSSGVWGSQIRICPTCQRIYLSRRKPRPDKTSHCSLRCSQLAATYRYRDNKKGLRLKEKQNF